jgi:hypothetical protein
MSKNILSYNDMFTMRDYQKIKLEEQYNRLYHRGKDVNEREAENKEGQRFYNLSLKQIMINLVDRLVKILNAFVDFINDKEDKTLSRAVAIITEGDRLIYLGLFIIIIAMFLFFIGGTS